MNTILKITLVSFAALTINSAFAQNSLEKRDIKKADSAPSAKSQPAVQKAATQPATVVSEKHETNTTSQPESPKQATVKEAKTPAQMAKQPLKRQVIYKEKEGVKITEEK